ncbi:MAG: hypothetical protein PVH19_10920 [Planctomycetia bacterium]
MLCLRTLSLALAILAIFFSTPLSAGVVVNPNNNGATDVLPADPTRWTDDTDAYVGKTALGELLVDGTSQVQSYYGYLGYNSAATGIVTVDGAGSLWDNTCYYYVGYYGDGTLNVTDGATVDCGLTSRIAYRSGSTGMVNITGTNSVMAAHMILVGDYGDATLNITNGGTANSSTGHIGYQTSSNSTATVDGNGSAWNLSSHLKIAYQGTGTLNITGGGQVHVAGITKINENGTIHLDGGTLEGGALTMANEDRLSGTGSILLHGIISSGDVTLDSPDDLTRQYSLTGPGQNIDVQYDINGQGILGAGGIGSGLLTISNGLTVMSEDGYIGWERDSLGTVTVTGTDSTWINNDSLYVGLLEDAVLNITDGGRVETDNCYLCQNGNMTATLSVDGPGSVLKSEYFSICPMGQATIQITNGGKITSEEAYLKANSSQTSDITVEGTNSKWTNSEDMYVSTRGKVTMLISDGGAVSNDHGYHHGRSHR